MIKYLYPFSFVVFFEQVQNSYSCKNLPENVLFRLLHNYVSFQPKPYARTSMSFLKIHYNQHRLAEAFVKLLFVVEALINLTVSAKWMPSSNACWYKKSPNTKVLLCFRRARLANAMYLMQLDHIQILLRFIVFLWNGCFHAKQWIQEFKH